MAVDGAGNTGSTPSAPTGGGETSGGAGSFDEILGKIEALGIQRAERDLKTTEVREDVGAKKNAATRTSA